MTNMLCCFFFFVCTSHHFFVPSLPPHLTLRFHFYRLRPAHCVLSTSAPSGTEEKMTWQAYPFLIIWLCVRVCVSPHASFILAFSSVALVPAFSDCCVFFLSTHTNTDAHTPRCRCKANWEFTACCVRERLALLSVLVSCQFCFSVHVFVRLWFLCV